MTQEQVIRQIKFIETVLREQNYNLPKNIVIDTNYVSASAYGQCKYNLIKQEATIRISKPFYLNGKDKDIISTICHEFAHAIMPEENHSKKWKNIAYEIGSLFNVALDSSQRTSEYELNDGKNLKTIFYKKPVGHFHCDYCNKDYFIYKKPKCSSYQCSHCRTTLQYFNDRVDIDEKPKTKNDKIEIILKLKSKGYSVKNISKEVDLSTSMIYWILRINKK